MKFFFFLPWWSYPSTVIQIWARKIILQWITVPSILHCLLLNLVTLLHVTYQTIKQHFINFTFIVRKFADANTTHLLKVIQFTTQYNSGDFYDNQNYRKMFPENHLVIFFLSQNMDWCQLISHYRGVYYEVGRDRHFSFNFNIQVFAIPYEQVMSKIYIFLTIKDENEAHPMFTNNLL